MLADAPSIRIVHLRRTDVVLLDQVEILFRELYQTLEDLGLVTPLVSGGERMWRSSIEVALGRHIGVTVALNHDERVLGFVHTSLLYLPDYLGGAKGARLGHIYVAESARKRGLPARMWERAEEWLRDRGAVTVDVQAQMYNNASRSLWPRLGFEEDLVQYRKNLTSS
jgi:GNAT superfamily N-acetyltransferase